jgi:hypothetical protein
MRTQTRSYTNEYQRINANVFKSLLTMTSGMYSLNAEHLSNEHCKFKLSENKSGERVIIFKINNKPHKIKLSVDNRSASTKLYLNCPYCKKNRESLYAIKAAYACRKCISLHYQSQSERPKDRLLRSIRKNRINLWGNRPNINNLCYHFDKEPYKKRMVYYSKLNKLINLEQAYLGLVSLQIERMRKMAGY